MVSLIMQATGGSAHYNYNGSGTWERTQIYYKIYSSGDYATAASGAMADWSNWTDVTLTATAPDYEDIAVLTYYGGTAGPYGFAQVCSVSIGCWDPLPWSSQYTYAEALINIDRTSSWSTNKKRYVTAHEIGHTLSLGHVDTDPWELMFGTCCETYDTYGTYQPTSHEIAAVNAAY
ncbi:MAG TPA: matrixin family metalloprotease [Candidatus Limnocylindria bacterium]|nr:matrixin family metalloprotease [Candidatus Limnocylindria bacterium]